METIDNILEFLDGLEGGKGKEMAKAIRNQRDKGLEKWLSGESKLFQTLKDGFDTFLTDYDLEAYRNEMTVFLAIASFMNSRYNFAAKQRHRQTKTKNEDGTDNSPQLKELELFEGYDFSKLDKDLNWLVENYPETSIRDIFPLKINSISITTFNKKTETIQSPEITRRVEYSLSSIIKQYFEDGTFEKLQNTPRSPIRQIKKKFAKDYLRPVFLYLKTINPEKSQPYLCEAITKFWGLFYFDPYKPKTFERHVL